MPQSCSSQGKTVKILTVGRKGNDILQAVSIPSMIVDTFNFREVKQVGFVNAQQVADKILAMFDAGEFDVATLFFAKFSSVISQVPTAQQLIPAKFDGRGEGAVEASASPTTTSRARKRSSTTCCRAISRCRSSGRCSKTTPRSTARR